MATHPGSPAVNTIPKLSLSLLSALVIGSMTGGGIFNLPQNVAVHAGAAAILISWVITGVGMLMLCLVYQTLAVEKPMLNNGVYAYARASAGEFVGFNSAWGYWISACLNNVAYLIAFFAAVGCVFAVFGAGNTATAILSASIMLWLIHGVILLGIRGATLLNSAIVLIKVMVLLLFIGYMCSAFRVDVWQTNFWGPLTTLSLFEQVKKTMLVTVAVLIGVEGASVYSTRARHRADIGKATLIGFTTTLVLLIGMSVLPLGALPRVELAQLHRLAMAEILEKIGVHWGTIMMLIGALVAIGGALLAWTLLAAETLFIPAGDGLMPRFLAKENKRGVPANALWLTNGVVQLFLLMALFLNETYLAMLLLATAMILVPYLFSAVYAIKVALEGGDAVAEWPRRRKEGVIGMIATSYCCGLFYAAGFKYLLLSVLLYLAGAGFYWVAKRQQGKRAFRPYEQMILSTLLVLAAMAGYLLGTGRLVL